MLVSFSWSRTDDETLSSLPDTGSMMFHSKPYWVNADSHSLVETPWRRRWDVPNSAMIPRSGFDSSVETDPRRTVSSEPSASILMRSTPVFSGIAASRVVTVTSTVSPVPAAAPSGYRE
jgi:hypothetical protein